MGGQNFRGFALRAVAPVGVRNDNGEPSDRTVGGNFMFFAGAELRHPSTKTSSPACSLSTAAPWIPMFR